MSPVLRLSVVAAVAALSLAAQGIQWGGPISGLVYDSPSKSLRQILGFPGGARLGPALLEEVGLGATFAERYPHELSGGQRQRIAIARAVVRRPAFVIADEPVSALDVTVRAQILKLFAELQDRHGFSCLFISHDLGVVEQVAVRVIVMHQGRIIEEGTRDSIFDHPAEAYTRRLLSAIPFLETTATGGVEVKWRKPD